MGGDTPRRNASYRARRFDVIRRNQGLLAACYRMGTWASRQSLREVSHEVSRLYPRELTISHPRGEFRMLGSWSDTAGTGERHPESGGLEPPVSRAFADVMASIDEPVFYDVGAAGGYYARLASQYTPPSQIHAFEGNSTELSYFRMNDDRYTDGEINLVSEFVGPDWIRLDEYATAHEAPDVVKIDVDTAEEGVLATMDGLFDGQRLPCVFLEVHFWGHYGRRLGAISDLLRTRAFDACMCLEHRDADSSFRPVEPVDLPSEPLADHDDYMLLMVPSNGQIGISRFVD